MARRVCGVASSSASWMPEVHTSLLTGSGAKQRSLPRLQGSDTTTFAADTLRRRSNAWNRRQPSPMPEVRRCWPIAPLLQRGWQKRTVDQATHLIMYRRGPPNRGEAYASNAQHEGTQTDRNAAGQEAAEASPPEAAALQLRDPTARARLRSSRPGCLGSRQQPGSTSRQTLPQSRFAAHLVTRCRGCLRL